VNDKNVGSAASGSVIRFPSKIDAPPASEVVPTNSPSDPPPPKGPIAFPPVPLVSGAEFTTEDGAEHSAESISIVLRSESGAMKEVPLYPRFGGWWPTR
jgi:hypothetical protein